jgi:hypothetical protein
MPPTNHRDQYSSNSDHFVTEKEQIHNNNENSFRGLLLGLLLALLVGGGITTLFLFNQNEEVSAPAVSPIPDPSVTPSSSVQPTTRETTIIREFLKHPLHNLISILLFLILSRLLISRLRANLQALRKRLKRLVQAQQRHRRIQYLPLKVRVPQLSKAV